MFAVTRSLVRNAGLRQGLQMMQSSRAVTMKVVPAAASNETFEQKQMRLKREMSPHLSIYKPQLTSMLSITFRGTGCALAAYAWSLGVGALMSSHDIGHYVTMLDGLDLGSVTLSTLKFLIAFPMVYHTCNGARHLLWDCGIFLKINEVYTTGYAMLASSIALSAVLAVL